MLRSSIRRTPSQLHSLQQIPTQHYMLSQHLVYKNELKREYVITLARKDETHWWLSEQIETCRSGFKCFKWKLFRCICWLIVKVILRNARCNDEIQGFDRFHLRQNLFSINFSHSNNLNIFLYSFFRHLSIFFWYETGRSDILMMLYCST